MFRKDKASLACMHVMQQAGRDPSQAIRKTVKRLRQSQIFLYLGVVVIPFAIGIIIIYPANFACSTP